MLRDQIAQLQSRVEQLESKLIFIEPPKANVPLPVFKLENSQYNNYEPVNSNETSILRKYSLSEEASQVKKYAKIFKDKSFYEHYEVNNYIGNHNLWNDFSKIRSFNDHGNYKRIPGIQPKYFAIVCEILEITGAGGSPLDKAEPY